MKRKAHKVKTFGLLLLLLLALPTQAEESQVDPLEITGNLLLPVQGRGSLTGGDDEVRAVVVLKNTKPGKLGEVKLNGRFYGLDDQEVWQDETTAQLKSRGEEAAYLYFPNAARVIVNKAVVDITYSWDGVPFTRRITLESTYREPLVNYE